MKYESKEDKPYGNSSGAWHQQNSKSDPLDSRGGVPKKEQQVKQNAPAVNDPHDPAEKAKLSLEHGSKSYAAYNQVAAPVSGGNIPKGKSAAEGQGSNYRHNRNKTTIAGDGAATERSVDKDVRKNQSNANNDTSSRTKAVWGK